MANAIIARTGLGFAALAAATGAARADVVTPSFMGDPAIAIGILVVLIVIVWFLIRGALSISARDKSDDDDGAGVGVLEGIDEDDDKPKRQK